MKALISSIEPRETGYRVAQIEQDTNVFAVAEGLFWIDCEENLDINNTWYDPVDQQIKQIPIPIPPEVVVLDQPTTTGVQTL